MSKDNVFKDLKKKIDSKVKGAHASVLADSDIASVREWISTPALDLNRIISGGLFKGIPSKCLLGIVGPEHTFKSSFMILCMVEAQKKGYKPVIVDTEGGINNIFAGRWGLDINECLYVYTPWIEEVKGVLGQIYQSGEKFIIGIDSAGGLDRFKSVEDAAKGDPKADQGLLQKDIRSMLKILLHLCVKQDSVGIVCGHLYGRPGTVPMPDQVGGGKAMRYFPRILINLKREHMREGGGKTGQIVGTRLKASTLKNHLYPPFQEATVEIDYQNGINGYAGLEKLAEEAGMVEKSGSWYNIDGKKIQGSQAAANLLFNSEKTGEYLKKIDKWIASTGYSTANEEIEEAEKVLESSKKESGKKSKKT